MSVLKTSNGVDYPGSSLFQALGRKQREDRRAKKWRGTPPLFFFLVVLRTTPNRPNAWNRLPRQQVWRGSYTEMSRMSCTLPPYRNKTFYLAIPTDTPRSQANRTKSSSFSFHCRITKKFALLQSVKKKIVVKTCRHLSLQDGEVTLHILAAHLFHDTWWEM